MKKRRERKAVDYAVPPPERAQHDDLEVKAFDPKVMSARRVQIRTPDRLAKYLRIGAIDRRAYEAGSILGLAWAKAGLTQRTTVNLLATGGGRRDLTDNQVDARRQLTQALAGPRAPYADILVNVCCFDAPADTRRLRKALDLLAIFYGVRC